MKFYLEIVIIILIIYLIWKYWFCQKKYKYPMANLNVSSVQIPKRETFLNEGTLHLDRYTKSKSAYADLSKGTLFDGTTPNYKSTFRPTESILTGDIMGARYSKEGFNPTQSVLSDNMMKPSYMEY